MNKTMEETPDPGTPGTPGPTDSDFPSGWPIERIPLAGASGQTVLELVELPETEDDSDEIFRQYRDWVESASPGTVSPVILVTLPGARIFWAPGRAVAVASPGRAGVVRAALLEFVRTEDELRGIETELTELWPQLEADSPLAFEFAERSVRGRRHLARRFARVISLRAGLARLTPRILLPHAHPPTLAGQVGERLRDRSRLAQRLEFLEGQLEVFERVYDACAQRSSDFMLARRSHALEWVIIVLLLSQIILVGVEMMSAAGK